MRALAVVLVCVSILLTGSAFAACPGRGWSEGHTTTFDDWARNVTPVDRDGDGILDLIVTVDEVPTRMVWLKGAGDGTFGAPATFYTSTNNVFSGSFTTPVVADVNTDGYDDFLVANLGEFVTFYGSATGLGTPVIVSLSHWPNSIDIGNFDGDAALEMVTSSSYGFYVYDRSGNAFVQSRYVDNTQGGYIGNARSADFDSDGRFDVAVLRRMQDDSGFVDFYFRNADGTFTAPVSLAAGSFPAENAIADFNGDGRPDLAAANWYDATVSLYFAQASRQFTTSTLDTKLPDNGAITTSIVARDLDADGVPDLMTGNSNGGYGGNGMATFIGLGDGTFRTPSYYRHLEGQYFESIDVFAPADLDEDGDLDVVVGAFPSIIVLSPNCTTQVLLTTESPLISTTAEARLTASVAGFGGSMSLPLGTITLKEGTTTIQTLNVEANGKAIFFVPPMSAGDHTFTAEFSGNALLSAATSNSATQKVTTDTTTTTISTNGTQPVYGTQWPLTITVTGPSAGSDYEFVDIYVDGVKVTTHYNYNPLNLNLTPGAHQIYAKFLGSMFRPASTSATLNVTVAKATPTLGYTGATTVRLGESHTLNFLVASAAGTPTGTVQVLNGNTQLTSNALTGGTSSAYLTLTRGTHTLRAIYSGDANFASVEIPLTLNVLAPQPLAINTRALTTNFQISYVVPSGTTSMTLYRRTIGGQWEQATGWNSNSGIDSFTPVRGVIYEYQLNTTTNGSPMQSNIEGALLFTDDPITTGSTIVKRAHFTEMRDAVNLLRATAGLTAFAFDATFDTSTIVRAQHLTALQNAANEARNTLGMTTASFTAVTSGTQIRGTQVGEVRDAVR